MHLAGGVGRLSRWERWGVTPGLPAQAAGRQNGPALCCGGGWFGARPVPCVRGPGWYPEFLPDAD